jgi:small conductance mechanosensitive channel
MIFGIGYDDDLRKAKHILTEVVTADSRVLEDPAPKIAVSELADSSVNFIVRPWVKTEDYWEVRWALTEEIKVRFDAEGISIPFPQMDVHLKKEEA